MSFECLAGFIGFETLNAGIRYLKPATTIVNLLKGMLKDKVGAAFYDWYLIKIRGNLKSSYNTQITLAVFKPQHRTVHAKGLLMTANTFKKPFLS